MSGRPLMELGPELDTAIEEAKQRRDASRLSAQLIEVAIQSCETMITRGLDGFTEHVPEPEPNDRKFIGYTKYDKEGFVNAYDQLKPIRDLHQLLMDYRGNLEENQNLYANNYALLIERREMLQLRAQLEAQLTILKRGPQ